MVLSALLKGSSMNRRIRSRLTVEWEQGTYLGPAHPCWALQTSFFKSTIATATLQDRCTSLRVCPDTIVDQDNRSNSVVDHRTAFNVLVIMASSSQTIKEQQLQRQSTAINRFFDLFLQALPSTSLSNPGYFPRLEELHSPARESDSLTPQPARNNQTRRQAPTLHSTHE